SELVRPGNAFGGIGARSGAVVFAVPGGLFVRGLAPVVPACGTDITRQFSIDIYDPGVRTPGPPKADGAFGGGHRASSGEAGIGADRYRRGVDTARNPAVEDDVPGGLIGRSARLGREISWAIGVKLAVVEDGGGVAKDEVHPAFDIRVDVILAAIVG